VSHTVEMDFEPHDLECLKLAAEACGLEVLHKGTYRWYGRYMGDYPLPEGFTAKDMGRCDFALAVKGKPNAYEVGVVKARGRKGYALLFDFYCGGYGLEGAIGRRGGKLIQEYQAAVGRKGLEKLARMRGLHVHEKRVGGKIILEAR